MILDWRRVSHILAALVVLTTPALADPVSKLLSLLSIGCQSLLTAAITTGASYLLQRILTPRPKPGESPRH